MTFVLLIGSVMSISIFLIYHLCRFLHIEMKVSSLVLCAILALAINAIAAYLSPFLDEAHFLRLGGLVVLSAAFVTLYNEYLVRRNEKAKATETTTLAAAVTPAKETTTVAVTPLATAATVIDNVSETSADLASEATAEAIENSTTTPSSTTENIMADNEPSNPAAKVAETKLQTEAELIAKQRVAAAKKAAELTAIAAKPAPIEPNPTPVVATTTALEPEPMPEPAYIDEVAGLTNLDAILDYAYEKQSTEPAAAIWAYQQAIKRYADDDYVPFLIIELGNIYKNQADYKNTINTYIAALKLPIIATNDTMRAEFSKNLRYLGVVQDILNQHQALDTPFAQIPPAIMQEIEAEYQQRLATSS